MDAHSWLTTWQWILTWYYTVIGSSWLVLYANLKSMQWGDFRAVVEQLAWIVSYTTSKFHIWPPHLLCWQANAQCPCCRLIILTETMIPKADDHTTLQSIWISPGYLLVFSDLSTAHSPVIHASPSCVVPMHSMHYSWCPGNASKTKCCCRSCCRG